MTHKKQKKRQPRGFLRLLVSTGPPGDREEEEEEEEDEFIRIQ